jgi:4a-hydroxytetrahydrobiopterin dehydratase
MPLPLLTAQEIADALAAMPGWEREGDTIVRQYTLPGGFMGSVGFVNCLAEAAEEADHHPDLAISWNRVTVTLSTHSVGGITGRDLALAREADRLAAG